ncbi:hypothetical protein N9N67_07425 [Bacteriovoracaceae bacterium]|nr:hypothetical protein [Bacteriovoracaceae bacterium]
MRLIIAGLLLTAFACGRPHSSEQKSDEVRKRERLDALNQDYQEIVGNYIGSLELHEDGSLYSAQAELRIVQDIDSSTGLPLQPKIVGSISVFEKINKKDEHLISYGITNGSYDNKTDQLALDISDNLNIRGFANHDIIDAVLHSSIKGDVGKLSLKRE